MTHYTMSADNYIAVYKTKFGFSGFMLFASEFLEPPTQMPESDPLWIVDTQEQAIDKCEEESYLEYGYQFVGE